MPGLKANAIYYIECFHFDSELPKRALTVTSSKPGAPVLCDLDYRNENQQGTRIISTPYQKQDFWLRETNPSQRDLFQILTTVGITSGKAYAFQVSETSARPGGPREITLQPSDFTNTYQIWRFIAKNDAT
ncbi:hypothetical protein Clacol_009451 [Clathrus columnatus]|uniref:Uncharacterized protein n=1 Tax=Clathrus columnatus TaxID=1419009 RepID=A0AAV5ATE5_9AGAM|nr:hypothetical protein Clacol_009451 [Clathrus columnatus]